MLIKKRKFVSNAARSSNGRTTVSGTVYLGSSPSLAALRRPVGSEEPTAFWDENTDESECDEDEEAPTMLK